jgi:hypothetical protein
MKKFSVKMRRRLVINTDPQRRCYYGVNAKEELVWSDWEEVDFELPESRVGERLKFWRELNDYAIGERGQSARCEFKAEEV